MKLSKAQEKVMAEAKTDIDQARSMEYPDWLKVFDSIYQIPAWAKDDEKYMKNIIASYEKAVEKKEWYDTWVNRRNGIVLTHCNSKTLEKLAKYGLIEIIRDSNGEHFGIDTIKVLNY